MKTDNSRVCVYPKDIQVVMGKAYKSARLYLNSIKTHLNKKPHQVVSIQEFCDYAGLTVDDVKKLIN